MHDRLKSLALVGRIFPIVGAALGRVCNLLHPSIKSTYWPQIKSKTRPKVKPMAYLIFFFYIWTILVWSGVVCLPLTVGTFLDILECFGTFWDVLRHFWTFWDILVCFKTIWDDFGGFWDDFETFWDFLLLHKKSI